MHLTDVTCCGILGVHCAVQVVAGIGRLGCSCHVPHAVADVFRFGQVGKAYNIAGVCCCSVLIGYPHFNTVYGDAALNVGKCTHPLVVSVAEEMSEEEVLVGFVVVSVDFETCQLCAAI